MADHTKAIDQMVHSFHQIPRWAPMITTEEDEMQSPTVTTAAAPKAQSDNLICQSNHDVDTITCCKWLYQFEQSCLLHGAVYNITQDMTPIAPAPPPMMNKLNSDSAFHAQSASHSLFVLQFPAVNYQGSPLIDCVDPAPIMKLDDDHDEGGCCAVNVFGTSTKSDSLLQMATLKVQNVILRSFALDDTSHFTFAVTKTCACQTALGNPCSSQYYLYINLDTDVTCGYAVQTSDTQNDQEEDSECQGGKEDNSVREEYDNNPDEQEGMSQCLIFRKKSSFSIFDEDDDESESEGEEEANVNDPNGFELHEFNSSPSIISRQLPKIEIAHIELH